jgi:hypothetical protein
MVRYVALGMLLSQSACIPRRPERRLRPVEAIGHAAVRAAGLRVFGSARHDPRLPG